MTLRELIRILIESPLYWGLSVRERLTFARGLLLTYSPKFQGA
jgi:hypothetical protein